ncbi:hypothetical protein [Actinopolyspora mortivallis]|uniref:hypothetical protein n=1 Tax=Actinopolyspora mortivallis TaxID=33906 RepID=UPI00039BE7D7|nr:hypothetical protein [Actinopolyspora mortivallis]
MEPPPRRRYAEGDPRAPVLLLPHGTGGTPEDIAVLGREPDPTATLLAPASRGSGTEWPGGSADTRPSVRTEPR